MNNSNRPMDILDMQVEIDYVKANADNQSTLTQRMEIIPDLAVMMACGSEAESSFARAALVEGMVGGLPGLPPDSCASALANT